MTGVRIVITDEVVCPHCGVCEVSNPGAPPSDWVFNIRANRVCDRDGQWWSQCMVCAVADRHTKGWFCNG